MADPSFSVVVPAYQAERTLAATIASIAGQTERDVEVVVVDDGSTDATGELADRLVADAGLGRVVHQVNGGLPAARNAGIAASRGRWIALLDADDLWLPTYLARMRAMLEAGGPQLGIAYCDAWIYDERRRRIARRTAFQRYRPAVVPTDHDAFYAALLDENFFWVSACVPRSVFDAVGGFDETLRASEDWNMWLRIVGSGRRAVGTTSCLGLYRHSATQMSADTGRMLIGQRTALAAVAEDPQLDEGLREVTRERARRAADVQARGGDDPAWRRAIRPLLVPVRGVKDFRRRAPAEVRRAFPRLLV